jgi:serine protease Do
MKRFTIQTVRSILTAVAVAAIGFGAGMIGAGVGPGDGGGPTGSPGAVVPARSSDHPGEEGGSSSMAVAYSPGDPHSVARSFQDQFRWVSTQTLPVVVEINVVNHVTRRVQPNPFDFFFGRPDTTRPQEQEYAMRGMGSGVIVGRDGDTVYVLTNNHVAGEADEIEVGLYDGRTFSAELVGGDDLIDLAMLSFETEEEVPIAALGDSDSLEPGDWVFAVGNPLGFQSSITAGIVSATARVADSSSGMSGVTDYIQTDAAINRGNSGGALVNLDGEVVGINTWIASNSGGSIGLGFAIPVNNARRAIEDFIESGEVVYSWLGVQVSTLSPEFADEFFSAEGSGIFGLGRDDTPVPAGAFVTATYDQSPAERSGLRPGDLIVSVDGKTIADSTSLVRTVAQLEPGKTVPFVVIRGDEEITVPVETGRRDTAALEESDLWPGISVQPITDDLRERLEIGRGTRGVLVAGVYQGSHAQESGLQRGDVILAINGREVTSISDFYRVLGEVDNEEVQFRILRNGRQLILGFLRPTA